MTRRRLPPFGKALLEHRRAGEHPLRAWLLVGGKWSQRPEDAVCLPPDWRPGSVDWSPVSALWVGVVVRSGMADALLVALLGELVQTAAPVVLHRDPDSAPACAASVAVGALAQRCWDEDGALPPGLTGGAQSQHWRHGWRAGEALDAHARQARTATAERWPAPWSWELYDDYLRRCDRWGRAAYAELERRADAGVPPARWQPLARLVRAWSGGWWGDCAWAPPEPVMERAA